MQPRFLWLFGHFGVFSGEKTASQWKRETTASRAGCYLRKIYRNAGARGNIRILYWINILLFIIQRW